MSAPHVAARPRPAGKARQAFVLARYELQVRILAAIVDHGGPMTTREIADAVDWPIAQINDCARTMSLSGLIELDGTRRNPHAGCDSNVWRLSPDGRAVVARSRDKWRVVLLERIAARLRSRKSPGVDKVGPILAALRNSPGMRAMEVARATGAATASLAGARLKNLAKRKLVERRFDEYGQPRWYAVEGLP